MSRKGMVRWTALAMAGSMVMLSACNGGTTTNSAASPETPSSSEAASKPVDLSWLGNATGGLYPKNDALVVQELDKRFNVNLKVVEATSTDEQQMSMLYASGDIPNQFLVSANGIDNVIKQDLVRTVPVTMIQDVAPHLWEETLKNYPQIDKMSIYNGGNLLAIPQGTRELFPMTSVRTDWLSKLGLNMPTNLQEFAEVARQFTEGDPDGDGKKDTYAFSLGTGYSGIYTLAAAFGFSLPGGTVKDDSWLAGTDGTLVKAQVSDNFKALLVYLADLYKKGYIYPDVTIKADDDDALFSDGTVGMKTAGWTAFMPAYRPSDWFAMTFKKNPEATTDYLPQLTGPSGEPAVFESQSAVWRYTAIGEDTTDEQLTKILQIMDAQLTDMDVHNLIWRGQEGVHYTIDQNGMAVATDEFASQEKQAEAGLKFFIVNDRNEEQMKLSFGPEAEAQTQIQSGYKTQEQLIPSGTSIPGVSKYGADVKKIEQEFFLQAVTGNIDIKAEWENYKKSWNAAGGEQITKEVNEIYRSLQGGGN